MSESLAADLVVAAGVAFLVVGAGMVYLPAGLIVLGTVLALIGLAVMGEDEEFDEEGEEL